MAPLPATSTRRLLSSLVFKFSSALLAATLACGGEQPAPQEPPLDFAEARRFSPAQYADVARRSLPLDLLARKASLSFVESELVAEEIDFFENDELRRPGALVLLGREGDNLVGLTTRFYADINYPDPRLIVDGWGEAEIGRQWLIVYKDREACSQPEGTCESTTFQLHLRRKRERGRESPQALRKRASQSATIEYQIYDDHDIALLYIPINAKLLRDRPDLGLQEPTRIIERHIRDSSQLFGFSFSLVSIDSMQALRDAIQVESIGEKLLCAGFNLVLGPVVEVFKVPFQSLPKEIINFTANQIRKQAAGAAARYVTAQIDIQEAEQGAVSPTPTAPQRHPELSAIEMPRSAQIDSPKPMQGGHIRLRIQQRTLAAHLLGLVLPEPESPESRLLEPYLGQLAQASSTQWVAFTATDPPRGMLFVPEEQLNLNLELLRHGYVRLDLDDRPALRSFPELAQAAQAALDDGLGFARHWRNDSVYAARVRDAARG